MANLVIRVAANGGIKKKLGAVTPIMKKANI